MDDNGETRGTTTTRTTSSSSNMQDQLLAYSNKVQNILEKIQANIKESKFNIERTENGIKFDIAVKATIRDVQTTSTRKTPSTSSSSTEISE